MDIDPNKIIPINDCQGTCKTPIGCTCKSVEEEEDSHLMMKASDILNTPETKVELEPEPAKKEVKVKVDDSKSCTCGKNPGGDCGCKSGDAGAGCGCSKSKTCSTRAVGGCCAGTHKLEVYDWMENLPDWVEMPKMVEVQFKNTRKGYYLNSTDIDLNKGDIVAVEATPGHDIGEVTLTGKLVEIQMRKTNFRGDVKRVYRIAKPADIEKAELARAKEHKTMLRAREIAEELNLGMKISDVEYQGDGNKAIFYYIADERVDFRQLIKVYASEFRVKIEMKQIGARQEAGRVGGIGPCGRELCCSSAMSNFVSVSTSAARLQDIPLNPQKLAGQCGKLKCCLNYEVDVYIEAQRKLPPKEVQLETKDSTYYHFKTDILSGMMTYSTDRHFAANLVVLPKDRVFEVIRMNKRGNKPMKLQLEKEGEVVEAEVKKDLLDQDSIHRFDSEKKAANNKNNRRKKMRKPNSEEGEKTPQNQRREKPKTVEKKAPQEKKAETSQEGGEAKPQNKNNKRRNNNRNRRRTEGGDNAPKADNKPNE